MVKGPDGKEYVEVLVPVDTEEGQVALAEQELREKLANVEREIKINDLETKAGCAGMLGGFYAKSLEKTYPTPDPGEANKAKKRAAVAQDLGCLLFLYSTIIGHTLWFRKRKLEKEIAGERTELITKDEADAIIGTTRDLIAQFAQEGGSSSIGERFDNTIEGVGRKRGVEKMLPEDEIKADIELLRYRVKMALFAAGIASAALIGLILTSLLSSCNSYGDDQGDEDVELYENINSEDENYANRQ
ncbi:MAG: hypothetical protein Q8P68_01290 [Candidatus Peregrinibacteria bacterium]|nr:hypothetical protein [Candidatus Peregrinibacteria bacterium]